MKTDDLIRKAFSFSEKELISEIIEASVLHELITGESIQGEGDYIKAFPMVLQGCIRVVRLSDSGRELLLYYLRAGEICSMSLTCCMVPQKSKIKMIAEVDSVILTIPVEKPEKWMSEYKSWKVLMMNSYLHRFDDLLGTIDSLTFMKMDERLKSFFKERYKYTGETHFSGTHEDIANQLNTSREVVSRLLKKLEMMELVITERNSIDYSGLFKKHSGL